MSGRAGVEISVDSQREQCLLARQAGGIRSLFALSGYLGLNWEEELRAVPPWPRGNAMRRQSIQIPLPNPRREKLWREWYLAEVFVVCTPWGTVLRQAMHVCCVSHLSSLICTL